MKFSFLVVLPVLLFLVAPTPVHAQSADCERAPNSYDGPCYYGNLPAIFDDFAYTSAAHPDDEQHAQEANSEALFGRNRWRLRNGKTEQSRAWRRFNRGDLSIPAFFSFDPSATTMYLPKGMADSSYARHPALLSGFVLEAGTYHARLRFSRIGDAGKFKQAFWTHSPNTYTFPRRTRQDTTRYRFWSELDFEVNNYFHGDDVTRMDAGNHYGWKTYASPSRRDERLGGEMARSNLSAATAALPATAPSDEAGGPLRCVGRVDGRRVHVDEDCSGVLANRWWHLMIDVDEEARAVSYSMYAPGDTAIWGGAGRNGEPAWGVPHTIGPAFYPERPMGVAFSLHWMPPRETLSRRIGIEIDWFYHTPVSGLSHDDVTRQVERFRHQGRGERSFERVNTTGHATFASGTPADDHSLVIDGPARAECETRSAWTLKIPDRGTEYIIEYRYQAISEDDSPGNWTPIYTPTFAFAPPEDLTALRLEAEATNLWYPEGTTELSNGWRLPNPGNYEAQTARRINISCD